MGRTFEGSLSGEGLKVGLVVGRFNEAISERLLDGALSCLHRHGVREEDIDVARVPGSFELPLAAKKLASSGVYDAVICLGAVIRGETPHFDFVAGEAASGVARVATETGVPTVFGVLTTDTVEQAMDRAGLKSGNKGWDAAMTAIEMANLCRSLRFD